MQFQGKISLLYNLNSMKYARFLKNIYVRFNHKYMCVFLCEYAYMMAGTLRSHRAKFVDCLPGMLNSGSLQK